MNLKRHEFLVKKLKRKLENCLGYLESQQDENLRGILKFVVNQDVEYQLKPEENLTEVAQLGKRKKKEETIDMQTLLEVLSEARVYIRDTYGYCTQCKCPGVDISPCKHSSLL